ncbi:MAG: hypothetical protein IPM96_12285 [Ignavibacteria bacterium]|nr:hypothetical protein [Ignavibacteria bacterium]
MNKRLSNKLTMLGGVHAYLSEHENIYPSNPGMINVREKLHLKITEIQNREIQRLNVLKGKREAKATYRELLITGGLSFAAKLFDLGKEMNNIELSSQSDFTRSELDKQRDLELLATLEFIKENSEAYIEGLSAYGINEEKLRDYAANLSIYKSSLESKLTSEAIKSSAGKTLAVLFQEASQILRSLDKMMEEFYGTERQFYVGYKSARNIKDLGIRHKPDTQGLLLIRTGVNGEEAKNMETLPMKVTKQ